MRQPPNKNLVKTRKTVFTQLPTENVLEIFDYLSTNDIIYTFFCLNKRFNSILIRYKNYLNNFETPRENFYFWENILPRISSQIKQLTLTSTTNFCCSLNLFPNLKSVIISSSSFSIDYQQLIDLLENEQFNKLISFKIQCEIFDNAKFRETLIEKLFQKKTCLRTFECLSDISCKLEKLNLLPVNTTLHTLTLKLLDNSFGFSLLKFIPNIKSLNLIIHSFTLNNRQLDLSQIELKHFSLTFQRIGTVYDINQNGFLLYIKYIKQFISSVISLSINLSRISILNNQFNGNLLRQELLQSMTHLKQFHFYVKLEQEIDSVENLLSTFSNDFWFNHNWFIGIHGKYLYTLPFHFKEFYHFSNFNDIQSTNSMILNSSSTWYSIKSIHWQITEKLNLNLIKQFKIKIPNLTSITLNGFYSPKSDKPKDSILKKHKKSSMFITLDSVTNLYLIGYLTENFQEQLISILPNLKSLKLPSIPCFVPTIYQTIENLKISPTNFSNSWITKNNFYFSNVKHIEIELDDYRSHYVMAVWDLFKNFQCLILYFRSNNEYFSKAEANQMINMLEKLNLMKILTTHQIKNEYNSIQFIKKISQ